MERSAKQVLSVAVGLLPLYAALGLAAYWTLIDTKFPADLIYQHDHLLSEPATSRDEARKHEVQEVIGGTRVYVYREICSKVTEQVHVEASWTSNAMVWQAPVRSFPLLTGCTSRSYELTVPSSNPARDLLYTAVWRRDNNPLVISELIAPPIHIRALPPPPERR